ncbi:F-box/WD repeat-containing protein 4 [Desmophyllum pertusum]|uniref:F-box/WD repeat-containing protein 4 n=1 Tax=Desmophyllum pertusum TaxID=174260 RepID=A0A9X0CFX7_9CNID|nr:F-box/WD repeat-containing protein 4 [Desmophyllum pertusum]
MPLDQSERKCTINLNTLPDDVLFAILRYCDTRSLSVLSRVCRNLYRVARDDSIWKRIALGYINVHPSDRKCGFNWKELCRVSWKLDTWILAKDRGVIKFKCNLMPWIQLGRPQQLYVAQAADVVLYQNNNAPRDNHHGNP